MTNKGIRCLTAIPFSPSHITYLYDHTVYSGADQPDNYRGLLQLKQRQVNKKVNMPFFSLSSATLS